MKKLENLENLSLSIIEDRLVDLVGDDIHKYLKIKSLSKNFIFRRVATNGYYNQPTSTNSLLDSSFLVEMLTNDPAKYEEFEKLLNTISTFGLTRIGNIP